MDLFHVSTFYPVLWYKITFFNFSVDLTRVELVSPKETIISTSHTLSTNDDQEGEPPSLFAP